MFFRTGQLGGQQWIFGPASKIFIKNLKKLVKRKGERGSVSIVFSAQQTMSTLKCHGNFRPEIYLINLRLLNSSAPFCCSVWLMLNTTTPFIYARLGARYIFAFRTTQALLFLCCVALRLKMYLPPSVFNEWSLSLAKIRVMHGTFQAITVEMFRKYWSIFSTLP